MKMEKSTIETLGLEPTTVIGILARYCETSVIVVDLYKKLLKGRLAYRGRGNPNLNPNMG